MSKRELTKSPYVLQSLFGLKPLWEDKSTVDNLLIYLSGRMDTTNPERSSPTISVTFGNISRHELVCINPDGFHEVMTVVVCRDFEEHGLGTNAKRR